MSMAEVIEFDTLARFTPIVKWAPDEQRGKVIPFMSHREVSDELVCAAYEEFDSESSRWTESDEAPDQAALEQAQPLRLEEELFGELFERHGQNVFGVVMPGLFSGGSPIGS
jgi:hypothetical protein